MVQTEHSKELGHHMERTNKNTLSHNGLTTNLFRKSVATVLFNCLLLFAETDFGLGMSWAIAQSKDRVKESWPWKNGEVMLEGYNTEDIREGKEGIGRMKSMTMRI